MKLLVTGGAGFIGSHYVRAALTGAWGETEPEQVLVLDKFTYAGNRANLAPVADDERLRVVEGDICDRELVDSLVDQVDAVVHFAAESHVDRSIRNAHEFVMTNVVGTQTLLDSARVLGIEKFVHVSTDEVYGSIADGSWDEEQPLLPNSPYAASKASGDLIARSPGAHAEVTAVNGARGAGLTPQAIGVSRPICPACRGFLEQSGATIISPTTARWFGGWAGQ